MRVPHLLAFVAGRLGRGLAGLALVGGLGLPAAARAQAPARPAVSSQPAPSAGTRITLDGPRRDSLAFATLNPDAIASVEVPKTGLVARQLGPDEARLGGHLYHDQSRPAHAPGAGIQAAPGPPGAGRQPGSTGGIGAVGPGGPAAARARGGWANQWPGGACWPSGCNLLRRGPRQG